jgi:hypothetical protein
LCKKWHWWVIFSELHEEVENQSFGSTSGGALEKTWSWPKTPPFSWSRVLRVKDVWLDKVGVELRNLERSSPKQAHKVGDGGAGFKMR